MARKTQTAERTAPTTNGSLPKGWRIVRFGEVVRNVNEAERNPLDAGLERFVGLEHIEPENLHLKKWGNLADGDVSFTKRFRKGQLLFGKRRAYQRKVAVAEFDGICSSDILTLEPSSDELLPELLPFIVQSDGFFEHALDTSSGSLSPRTRWSQLQDYTFPLPPKDEQRRIADILWVADEALKHFGNCELSSTAILQAFSNECFPIPTDECDSGSQDLVELGQCCSFQSGYPFKSADFVESGDRLLRCSNVGVNCFNWNPTETRFWPTERRHEFKEFLLQAGDIVIAMDRPFVGNGFKVARLTQDDVPALLLQRVGRFIAKPDALTDYIWAFIHSQSFRWQLLRCQQGTDLPHISRFDVEQTRLPVPDIAKQREVSETFALLETAIAIIKGHSERLRAVKDALRNALLCREVDRVH